MEPASVPRLGCGGVVLGCEEMNFSLLGAGFLVEPVLGGGALLGV